jgi:hypothetical protein
MVDIADGRAGDCNPENFRLAKRRIAALQSRLKSPNFRKQVDRLCIPAYPDFGIGATVLLSRLKTNLASIILSLNEEDETLFEEFAMMAGMGFFVLTGERYQMVIPPQLNMKRVKITALKLAETEDEDFFLHPEYLVASVPYSQAKEWQARLRNMDEDHRCADRDVLLS